METYWKPYASVMARNGRAGSPLPAVGGRGTSVTHSRHAAGRDSPDLVTRLAPLNRPAPLLPLLHKLVEERAGERRATCQSWTVGRDSVEPKLDFLGKSHGSTESRPTVTPRH